MSGRMIFRCEGTDYRIALDATCAPRAVAQLKTLLPQAITIHCAKIAGCHIYWPSPLLARLETETDIHKLAPGTFLYWPDRQYLEIIYDELQAETAAVSVLGRLEGDIGWLKAYADRQRREHGSKVFTAWIGLEGVAGSTLAPLPEGRDPLSKLRRARLEAWRGEPPEVATLLAREGLNIPFGPLVTAEGAFRHTHEITWRLWNDQQRWSELEKRQIAIATIELAIARIAGFAQMQASGTHLGEAIAALWDDTVPVGDALAETVLYCGRMSGWLDLHMPWWPANELTKEALGRGRAD